MILLIALPSIALGIAVLVGVSNVVSGWDMELAIGTSTGGGHAFLLVVGLLLLISGLAQLFSRGK